MDFDDRNSRDPHERKEKNEENTTNRYSSLDEPSYEEATTPSPSQHSTEPDSNKPTNKPSKKWHGISATIGGLIGGIIAAAIVALLFTTDVLPIADNENEEAVPATVDGRDQSGDSQIVDTIASDDAIVSSNIDEVSNAVVGVVNLQQRSIWTGSEEAGTGSGIIYKKEDGNAYVVTNQHVVDGAEQVEIVLDEEERLPATVLGEDALTDLAVLEVDGETIDTVAQFGSSEDIQVGETVLAIGNPLGLEFANSVTRGIISGLNRSVPIDSNSDGQADWVTEVLQTDAAINPGNSGGALVNTEGEVIGINSMKIAQGAVEGIGFAIPVDSALPIMEQLETEGSITRPMIGISTAALYQVPPQYRYEINLPDDIEGGMVIANVEPRSPADRAGLQQFDVITRIDDTTVTSILELRQVLYSDKNVGDEVEIEYIRDGEVETTTLVLDEIEEDDAA
jgi:serine protease Do